MASVDELRRAWESGQDTFELHTSGATGPPKRIVARREQVEASAQRTIHTLGICSTDRLLLALSPDTIAGFMVVVRSMLAEAELVVVPPSAKPLANLDHWPTVASLVPYQVAKMMDDPTTVRKLRAIRTVLVGGGPIPSNLEQKLASYPNFWYHTYGMTETLSHVALRRVNGPEASQVYQAMPGVSFSQGAKGQLIIYDEALGHTALETTDMVALASKTAFHWKGRLDYSISTGGATVHPQQVEAKLSEHPALANRNYFVGPEHHEQLAQQVSLWVEGTSISEEELDAAFQLLDPFERPKAVHYCHQFVRSTSGKILRQQSQQQCH